MLENVRLFKGLGDETRLRILKMLEPGELCVCEVTEVLGLSQPTVSKHLSILKDAGLILGRKDGRWCHYRLNTDTHDVVRQVILGLVRGLDNDANNVGNDKERLKSIMVKRECA